MYFFDVLHCFALFCFSRSYWEINPTKNIVSIDFTDCDCTCWCTVHICGISDWLLLNQEKLNYTIINFVVFCRVTSSAQDLQSTYMYGAAVRVLASHQCDAAGSNQQIPFFGNLGSNFRHVCYIFTGLEKCAIQSSKTRRFPCQAITFHSHLLYGQGPRHVLCQLNW